MSSGPIVAARDHGHHASCLGTATRLEGAALDERLSELPRWSLEAGALRQRLQFEHFPDAMAFVVRVALLAERENHHPTLTVDKHDVEIVLWTRQMSGVTDLDVALARAIDTLIGEHG